MLATSNEAVVAGLTKVEARTALRRRIGRLVAIAMCIVVAACGGKDASPDDDWPVYGGGSDQQHYSPLTQIDTGNVGKLGLVWSYDLPPVHSATEPVSVGGRVFVVNGHGDVRALDAGSGELLWEWESGATERSGAKLRQGYGPKGLTYAQGRVIVATHDGRLAALDVATGKVVWSVETVDLKNNAYVNGAPRSFGDRIVIGFGGADGGGVRGYVSCYDAADGRLLWRFYTVPGNPAVDKDETTRIAAKSWSGEWWKKGAGGTAWNAFAYDADLKLVYIGTGNGYPYNQVLRSPDGGDNLFLASIVAVDANTGKYVWHYQVNPGEQWDYKATSDITLATLGIDGKPRKVLMQAPTNGFFYVIDRQTGELLSAEPFTKVTWAERIDIESGRPVENPGARYHGRSMFEMWPSILGGHSWPPQSYSPQTGLVYLPTIRQGMLIGDRGIDLSKQELPTKPANINSGMGVSGDFAADLDGEGSSLQAWDPVAQKARWSVELPGRWPGGTMATGGGLVFQGRMDNLFDAYDARTGERLWSFDARAPIVAAPISYSIKGRQYVTVITGNGAAGGGFHSKGQQDFAIDYRIQARRVLTFALGGTGMLPAAPASLPRRRPDDLSYRADPRQGFAGMIGYATACATCHGADGIAAGTAPDLRLSPIPADQQAFLSVVKDGALVANGMPRFDDMPTEQVNAIRQYLRAQAQKLPPAKKKDREN